MPDLNSTQSAAKRVTAATDAALGTIVPHQKTRRFIRDLFPNLRDAAIRWSEDDAGSMAAAVAYYLALSLFPMVLLLISGLGLFLKFTQSGQDANQELFEVIGQQGSPVVEQTFRQVVDQLKNNSVVSGPTGLIAAILAAIGVFAQLDRGFDRIWRVKAPQSTSLHQTILGVIHHRLSAFLMLVALGGLIAVLFVVGVIIGQIQTSLKGYAEHELIRQLLSIFDYTFTIVVNSLLFAMIYKFLPKKHVPWRYALRGGLLTAFIWEIGRALLGAFLIGMRYTSAYGILGSFIALLLWCYYAISIIFFGAEYIQVVQRRAEEKDQAENEAAQSTIEAGSIAESPSDELPQSDIESNARTSTQATQRPSSEKQRPRPAERIIN
jgi:membrane protein